jgi:hypothetical protein
MEEAVLLSRGWLLLSVPAFLAGLWLIVVSVRLLLRTVRVPELARLPLVAEQDVDLPDSGPLMFVIDKPRFQAVRATGFLSFNLAVSLEDEATGRVLNAAPTRVPFTVQGITRSRIEMASLASIRPGLYRLRVAGLVPDLEDGDSFLVITRPVVKLAFVGGILAIIAASTLTLGGLIASVAVFVKFQSGG